MRTFGLIGISSSRGKQQQWEDVTSFCIQNAITLDGFIDLENLKAKSSGTKASVALNQLLQGDRLVLVGLSQLGNSLNEIVTAINDLMKKDVSIICTRQGVELNPIAVPFEGTPTKAIFGMLADAAIDLKHIKNQKAHKHGKTLGRPEGAWGLSKLDEHKDEIINYLNSSHTLSEISRNLKVSRTALRHYVKTRGLLKNKSQRQHSSYMDCLKKNAPYRLD